MQNEELSNGEKAMTLHRVLCTVDFDKRISKKHYYDKWHNGQFWDSYRDEGEIDYSGLDDVSKLCLYIYSWNLSDILPSKKGILKKFGWTNYKLQKLIKECGKICTLPTFNQEVALLSGSGYFYSALRVA